MTQPFEQSVPLTDTDLYEEEDTQPTQPLFLSSLCSQNFELAAPKSKSDNENGAIPSESESQGPLDLPTFLTRYNWLNRNLALNGLAEFSLSVKTVEEMFDSESKEQISLAASALDSVEKIYREYMKQMQDRQDNFDAFNRVKNDKEQLIQAKEKLELRMGVMKQDMAFAETREKTLVQQHKKDKQTWDRERDELRKQLIVIQSREKQYLNELKKKDLQFEKLKEKLTEVQKGSSKPQPRVLNPPPKTTVTGRVVSSSASASSRVLAPKSGLSAKSGATTSSSSLKTSKIAAPSAAFKVAAPAASSKIGGGAQAAAAGKKATVPEASAAVTPAVVESVDPFKIGWENEQKRNGLLVQENNALRNTLKLLQEEFHNLLVDANLSDERFNDEIFDLPMPLLEEVMEESKVQMQETGAYIKENDVKIINHRSNQMGLDQLENTVSMMKQQFPPEHGVERENSENL